MTNDCAYGALGVSGDEQGLIAFGNMDLMHYGYTTLGEVSMRLDNNFAGTPSGVCSVTLDSEGNAWADSYQIHWGNALHVWLR